MTRYKFIVAAVLCCGAVGVTGCGPTVVVRSQADLVDTSYAAIDDIVWQVGHKIPAKGLILVSSFVDNNDLTQSSALGRLLGEASAGRLTKRGYTVVNMKMRQGSVVVRPRDGEFFLSRDAKEIDTSFKADAVLVGTYVRTSVGPNVRSFSERLELADRQLALDAVEYGGHQRIIEIIPDYIYVSVKLINAADNTVIAAHDYRIRCDDGLDSLLSPVVIGERGISAIIQQR